MDITMCSPTKFNLSNPCQYISDSTRKGVSIETYNEKMSEIIATFSDKNIAETLIALLDEASKYTIRLSSPKSEPVKSSLSKRRKNEQKSTQVVKRVRK